MFQTIWDHASEREPKSVLKGRCILAMRLDGVLKTSGWLGPSKLGRRGSGIADGVDLKRRDRGQFDEENIRSRQDTVEQSFCRPSALYAKRLIMPALYLYVILAWLVDVVSAIFRLSRLSRAR